MISNFLKLLICPKCEKRKFKLEVEKTKKNIILNGVLKCGFCHARYKIINDVPVFPASGQDNLDIDKSFSTEWKLHKKGYFQNNDLYGKNNEEELKSFEQILKPNNHFENKYILDAGCGSGRLTYNLAKKYSKAKVIGADVSQATFDVVNTENLNNFLIINSDIRKLPFTRKQFDIIWSEGVLHHTKSTQNSFYKLFNYLKEGGIMYFWIYPKYIQTPYKLIRNLLPFSYKFPYWLNLLLSYIFSLPVFIIYQITNFVGIFPNSYLMKSISFKLYDSLSPRYQHYHSKKEVIKWLNKVKPKRYSFIGDLGVLLTK